MNAVTWFEIPAANFERACRFYETILAIQLKPESCSPAGRMAFWPHGATEVGGCIFENAQARPHQDGVRIYLDAGEDLNRVLARVEAAGGQVIVPKTLIRPEIGYFAILADTEGNAVGLHSLH